MKPTPGPWSTCCERCFTVTSKNHPIAKVIHGAWGDEWPSVRIVGETSLDRKAEGYMEMCAYGEVPEDEAKANLRVLAAAPDMLWALEALAKEEAIMLTLSGIEVPTRGGYAPISYLIESAIKAAHQGKEDVT